MCSRTRKESVRGGYICQSDYPFTYSLSLSLSLPCARIPKLRSNKQQSAIACLLASSFPSSLPPSLPAQTYHEPEQQEEQQSKLPFPPALSSSSFLTTSCARGKVSLLVNIVSHLFREARGMPTVALFDRNERRSGRCGHVLGDIYEKDR